MDRETLRRLFPNASAATLKANADPPRTQLPHAELESHQAPALERAVPREKESLRRTRIRFIGYRVRPLDPDNFAGSVKDLLDGLRHASLLDGDEDWRIELETRQEKVGSYAQEKTVIEIILPDTENTCT